MVALASSCRFSFSADALGRRVGRDDGTDDVVYFQDGQQTLADYASGASASSPAYTYVYGSYIDEPVYRDGSGGVRYYHRNQQYSVTALTNASGTITERYSYTAYGAPTITDASGTTRTATAEGNRYTYTGREWDEDLGLYHYRARMYDAVAGRFCSRDPIGYVSAFSLYDANPFGNGAVDPFGLTFLTDTVYMTVDEIRALDDPRMIAGTRIKNLDVFRGDTRVFVEKKGECCFCASVSKNVRMSAHMEVEVILPYPVGSGRGTGDSLTSRGWQDVVGHEMRRVDVNRNGYNEYLEGAISSLGNCDGVCRKDREGARAALQSWVTELRSKALQQFVKYWTEEQGGIDEEYLRPQRPRVDGKHDGFEWKYKVKPPPALEVPGCPPSDC